MNRTPRTFPRTYWLQAITLICTIAATIPAAGAETYRLHALDVGEGQAILIQRAAHGILIDTGHAGQARRVLDRLNILGVRKLDYLIFTHLHPDHASGYFRIREAFPDAVVLDNHHALPITQGPDMVRWVADALIADPRRRSFRAGDAVHWQGLTIRALWPRAEPGPDLNESSLVIELTDTRPRVLLMGDVGTTVEEALLRDSDLAQDYGVLVAGHHGSRNTSGDGFLERVKPAFSIISINVDNIRGYPSPETVARLRRHSRHALLTTYQQGDVCLEWYMHQPVRPCDEVRFENTDGIKR